MLSPEHENIKISKTEPFVKLDKVKKIPKSWFLGQNEGFELFDHEFSKEDKKRPESNIPSRPRNWPLCYV